MQNLSKKSLWIKAGTSPSTIMVVTGGVSNAHTGLTVGAEYYADGGDLNTDGNGVLIGTAISTTEILLNSRDWYRFR